MHDHVYKTIKICNHEWQIVLRKHCPMVNKKAQYLGWKKYVYRLSLPYLHKNIEKQRYDTPSDMCALTGWSESSLDPSLIILLADRSNSESVLGNHGTKGQKLFIICLHISFIKGVKKTHGIKHLNLYQIKHQRQKGLSTLVCSVNAWIRIKGKIRKTFTPYPTPGSPFVVIRVVVATLTFDQS